LQISCMIYLCNCTHKEFWKPHAFWELVCACQLCQ
jgi:hypothetical protein